MVKEKEKWFRLYLPKNDGSVSFIEALPLLFRNLLQSFWKMCVIESMNDCECGWHLFFVQTAWAALQLYRMVSMERSLVHHPQSEPIWKPVLSPCGNSIFAFMCYWWSHSIPQTITPHTASARCTILFWVEKSIELFIISGPSKWPLPSYWNAVSESFISLLFNLAIPRSKLQSKTL